MDSTAQQQVIADLKLVVEGYRGLAGEFERALNEKTAQLMEEEKTSQRLYEKLQTTQRELEAEKRYTSDLKGRLSASAAMAAAIEYQREQQKRAG